MNKNKLATYAAGASIGTLAGLSMSHAVSQNSQAPPHPPKHEQVVSNPVSTKATETLEDYLKLDKHKLFREGNRVALAKIIGEEYKITVHINESKYGLVSGTETTSSTPITAPAGLGHTTTRTKPLQTEQFAVTSEDLESPKQALSDLEFQAQAIAEETSKNIISEQRS